MEVNCDGDATCDDRISKLPEPILHHIMSFLYAKHVAQMSTSSKALATASNSLSYLNFGYISDWWSNCYFSPLSYVDRWIKILIDYNIKELDLRVVRPDYRGNIGYDRLPEKIFAARSLNVLSLYGFKIELPADDGMIKLSSLQELHLSYVFLDEKFIESLCTSCCNLEHLSFRYFDGLTSFQVCETLPKLKKVNLQLPCSVLQLVDIAAFNVEELRINSLNRSIKVVRITACKDLKSLYLGAVDVTDNWLEELFYSLQNVEKFELSRCDTLKTMKNASGRLKWLITSDCDNLIAADFDKPNLLKFQYSCHPLPTFKLKASVLLEAIFQLYPICGWHSKLMKFLGNFNHSQTIELSCCCDEDIIIPKDLRENILPPLYGTNILQVNFRRQFSYSVVDIVDSMLWISPHLHTLSFTQAPGLKTLKFIYEDASDEDKKCCASLPWECWRHTLKKVELHNFSCMEEEKLRNYFFANADNLKMVEISL
ncbi:hypothetical protein FXO38_22772 [Capsicum annuum]|uniref:At1g61320/AtMIF1 LRR domain-containing protein n=3 Tax=Capsicum annuum TaxID=4072 RepID=A0A2G2ZBE5_CAPAN|nr:hypothetical protein FXO38_22772 [Capsicum annuum]PHT79326.1 hypothetical protein T459_17378 [Capsicum annuum]